MPGMSGKQLEVIRLLLRAPFSSAGDLGRWGPTTSSQADKMLRGLKEDGRAVSYQVGMAVKSQERSRLTGQAVSDHSVAIGEPIPWASTEAGLKRLLDSPPMFELVYSALRELISIWGRSADDASDEDVHPEVWVTRFDWLPKGAIRAAVELSNGMELAFLWAGKRSSREDLSKRLLRQLKYLEQVPPGGWWDCDEEPEDWTWQPSIWVVVGEDHWACAQGEAAVRDITGDHRRISSFSAEGFFYRLGFAYVASGALSEARTEPRLGKPHRITTRLAQSEFQALNGKLQYRVFGLVESFQPIRASVIRRMTREGGAATRALSALVDANLLRRLDGYYYLDEKGHEYVLRRDGQPLKQIKDERTGQLRFPGFLPKDSKRRKDLLKHDFGVAKIASRFMEQSASVVAGPRAVRNIPGVTQLAPDLLVLARTPRRKSVLAYLEYERSAHNVATFQHKLAPYMTFAEALPHVAFCVLVVVDDPAREPVIWRVGGALDIYTTSLEEVLKGNVVGAQTVWRRDGTHAWLEPLKFRSRVDVCQLLQSAHAH